MLVVLSTRSPVPTGTPALDGVPLATEVLGELAKTPCFPDQTFTGAFRADVTALVVGDGRHALTGLIGDGTWTAETLTEGATLLVVGTEPSALDLRPGSEPLRVTRRSPGVLAITGEDGAESQLWRGAVGLFHDHAPVACGLRVSAADVPSEPGDWYSLAAGCGPTAVGGRDSFGSARPTAEEASGERCP
jgi:hypothetical protein